MSDEIQNADLTASVNSAPVETTAPETTAPSAPVETEAQKTQRLYTEEDMNRIAGKKKAEGYERARREQLEEIQRRQSDIKSTVEPQAPQAAPLGSLTADDLNKMIANQLSGNIEQIRQQEYTNRVKNEFLNKVQRGINKYGTEYEDFLIDLGLDKVNPQVVDVLNAVDNTDEILQDFRDNPHKFTNLLSTLREAPHLAYKNVANLSSSIKVNQTGSQMKSAPEPISQIKSSPTGLGDSGSPDKLGVRELKRQPWLKG